jgi:hypothetical protein
MTSLRPLETALRRSDTQLKTSRNDFGISCYKPCLIPSPLGAATRFVGDSDTVLLDPSRIDETQEGSLDNLSSARVDIEELYIENESSSSSSPMSSSSPETEAKSNQQQTLQLAGKFDVLPLR